VCVEEEEREGRERRRREGQISVAKKMNRNAVYRDLIYVYLMQRKLLCAVHWK
jgi:hypothetical protein